MMALTPQAWAVGAYLLGVFAFAALLVGLSFVLGGRSRGRAKDEPFESGIVSVGSARLRMPAKFYLVAMFFVIFDLEAVYLYAWAISVRQSGWSGLVEVTIFVGVLLIALLYIARTGGLDWTPRKREIGGTAPGSAPATTPNHTTTRTRWGVSTWSTR